MPNTTTSHYKTASTVTVSQVKGLVNQMVQVSWTGFTPSSKLAYENTQTDYPVMLAECKGTNPKSPDDCYDATNGGEPAAFGKYGPGNTSYATTTAQGTGKADILLFTNVQNQFLGCNATTPCSLVVPARAATASTSPSRNAATTAWMSEAPTWASTRSPRPRARHSPLTASARGPSGS